MYERRRLERRLRDKEAAYQEVCVYLDMVKIIPVDLHHQYNLILSLFFFFFSPHFKAAQKLGDPGEEEIS